METTRLPRDVNALLALAEEIAHVLSETETELGEHAEARLRASIAAATFAGDAYVAVRAGAKQSPVARLFLVPAKQRYARTLEHLRYRLARSIGALCSFLDDEDLVDVTDYVLSIRPSFARYREKVPAGLFSTCCSRGRKWL